MQTDWARNLPVAVTVCDSRGTIVYMNEKSCKTFEKDGGRNLVGKNVLDCHPEPARGKLKKMLETRATNCYTMEKAGVKKLIYQTPWYDENNEFGGMVELSMQVPFDMPHFVRAAQS
ncbi:MAG: PAS domain-containing protein [Ignavibacteriales bacterium]